jgi:hypothetical protein
MCTRVGGRASGGLATRRTAISLSAGRVEHQRRAGTGRLLREGPSRTSAIWRLPLEGEEPLCGGHQRARAARRTWLPPPMLWSSPSLTSAGDLHSGQPVRGQRSWQVRCVNPRACRAGAQTGPIPSRGLIMCGRDVVIDPQDVVGIVPSLELTQSLPLRIVLRGSERPQDALCALIATEIQVHAAS